MGNNEKNMKYFRSHLTTHRENISYLPIISHKIKIKAERATIANVELDQRSNFDGAMKLFRREINNSNVINELKRRRYHEETWMMRRRKMKERGMRAKRTRNVMTLYERDQSNENTIFDDEFGTSDILVESWRNVRAPRT